MSDKRKAQVFHFDLYGKREDKYNFLNHQSIDSIQWNDIEVNEPAFIFILQDRVALDSYNKGISIEALFAINATGVKTEKDDFTIRFNRTEINTIISDLVSLSVDEIRLKYKLAKDGRDWQLASAKKDILNNNYMITNIQYRPFDYRITAYTGITKGFMAYPREKIMSHLVKDNFAFVSTRVNRGLSQGYNFISRNILDLHLLDSASDSLQTFPLYLYPATNSQQTIENKLSRQPNLNKEIVTEIASKLELTFINEKEQTLGTFAPIDILDYIYAVLHSPTYREKYKEFLKIDFPRVPYPKDPETFWKLVALGGELRQIHLLESPKVNQFITTYPITGNNLVTKPRFESTQSEPPQLTNSPTRELISSSAHQLGTVWINDEQYFDRVPLVAWNFYIGGYQPAQKWLKDRKGRELSFEDILHYQKIIVALFETDRLMKEIDKITFE